MATSDEENAKELSRFLREHRDEVIQAWTARVSRVTPARRLDPDSLVDHFPQVLDRITTLVSLHENGTADHPRTTPEAELHAHERMLHGFDLTTIIEEFRVLRETVLELLEENRGPRNGGLRLLHSVLDEAVAASVGQYMLLRRRATRAIDSVAAVALASSSLDDFLRQLLYVFRDAMPAVQTCAVLLRENDRLVVRAVAGLELSLVGTFSVAIGEGFAGTIAKTREPLLLHSASTSSLVRNPVIVAAGVRALYGVPLLHPTEGVLGVVHMGSLTAGDFASEDKEVFEAMAARAALAIEYHRAKSAAEHALTARDDVLAVVAHDLRNPIGAALTSAGLLERLLPPESTSAQVQRALATIVRSERNMLRLVDDLLDWGAIESHQLRLRMADESPAVIVEEAVNANSAVAEALDVRLVATVKSDVATALPSVHCDRERIQQVFGNLISNALKAAPHGSEVTVGATSEPGMVCFSVTDYGPGIPKEDLAHIFERYWSGPSAPRGGRGLGLAIVKGVVEAHGGSVGAKRLETGGSTVFFRLPALS